MSSDDKDWDPLPREQVQPFPVGRAPGPRPPAPVPGRPPAPALDDDLRTSQEEKAARLLRQLQIKIDSTKPRDPLLKAINKAARRDDRRQQAAQAPFAATSRHETSGVASVRDIPLEVQFVEGCDEREQQKWFLQLPEYEQDRLRATWAHERKLLAMIPVSRRRERIHRFGMGLAIFVAVALPIAVIVDWRIGVCTLAAGLVTGTAWMYLPFGRFWCAGTAAAAYSATFLAPIPMMTGGLFGLDLRLCGALLVTGLAAALGTTREWEERGGFRSHNKLPAPEPGSQKEKAPASSVQRSADAPPPAEPQPPATKTGGTQPPRAPW